MLAKLKGLPISFIALQALFGLVIISAIINLILTVSPILIGFAPYSAGRSIILDTINLIVFQGLLRRKKRYWTPGLIVSIIGFFVTVIYAFVNNNNNYDMTWFLIYGLGMLINGLVIYLLFIHRNLYNQP